MFTTGAKHTQLFRYVKIAAAIINGIVVVVVVVVE
jgi:hypothetical protein